MKHMLRGFAALALASLVVAPSYANLLSDPEFDNMSITNGDFVASNIAGTGNKWNDRANWIVGTGTPDGLGDKFGSHDLQNCGGATPNCTDLLFQGIDGSGFGIGTVFNLSFDYFQTEDRTFQVQLFGMQAGDQIDRAQLRCEDVATNTASCTPLLTAVVNGISLSTPTDWTGFSIMSMPTTQTFAALAVVFRAANTCTDSTLSNCGLSGVDSVSLTAKVPEPGTLALFGLGLAGLGFARRSKGA